MTTPIYDFLYKYKKSGISRFHMPGHKGVGMLGFERMDVTEVSGADVLYHADGIIAESEENATRLFGTAHTYYSTEGSTLAIKAMLAIIRRGCRGGATVLAARNVHKAFVYAAGALDLGVEWIYPSASSHLCECDISPSDVLRAIDGMASLPDAVYITTPDYLGGMLDVEGIAKVCNSRGIPLLVDNAHGAYLALLEPSMHPIHLGAAMCADSAHKTLPVLTGGAYLHIAKGYERYTEGAREALSMFASTSPSYLTLASLDLCNYLCNPDIGDGREPYGVGVAECKEEVTFIKELLADGGQASNCSEPLKIRIDAPRFLDTGWGIADILRENHIEPEFVDDEFVVLMASPMNSPKDFKRLRHAVAEITARAEERRHAVDGIITPENATQGRTYDDISPEQSTAAANTHSTATANTDSDYTSAAKSAANTESGGIVAAQSAANTDSDCTSAAQSAAPYRPSVAMSIREALLSPSEVIPVRETEGRICAAPTVSCPPAIPVVISGEVIDEAAITAFLRYGIDTVSVVKER